MSLFSRVYQRLLPRARAFFFWQSGSQLRQFFEGLAGLPADARAFVDQMWSITRPAETDQLPGWEEEFALPDSGLTEADRRTRLAAAWAATGGQSPRYLQDVVQSNGFNVFVHEWWALPVLGGDPTPRNPNTFLSDSDGPALISLCGEADVRCGEEDARCGQTADPLGYLLVNKIRTSVTQVLGCGDTELACSDKDPFEDPVQNFAFCGQPLSTIFGAVPYAIPSDPDLWRYFTYWGGQTFPDQGAVDPLRRDEFEDLLLKLNPGQQWLGVLVDYTPT